MRVFHSRPCQLVVFLFVSEKRLSEKLAYSNDCDGAHFTVFEPVEEIAVLICFRGRVLRRLAGRGSGGIVCLKGPGKDWHG